MGRLVTIQLVNGDRAAVDPGEVGCIRKSSRGATFIILKSGYELPLDHAHFKTIEHVQRALAKEG